MISVILLTYNRPFPIFKRALDSILSQTYKNIQTIVVDNSTDSEISEKIAKYVSSLQEPNLQLISLFGILNNKARNIGFNAAKGEYVAFLDDDDEWTVGKLEKQLELFNNEVSLVYSNYRVMDSATEEHLFFDKPPRTNTLDADILGGNVIGCTSIPIMKKQAFIDVGGFDESFKANQEWDLWIRLLQNHEAAYSSEIAGIKHYSENSISNRKYRRFAGWASIFINHAPKYHKNKKQLKKALKHFIWEMFNEKMYFAGMIALPLYILLNS